MDSKITDIYLKMLRENGATEDMFNKGRDDDYKVATTTQRKRNALKAGADAPSYSLDDDDLEAFKSLDSNDQARVKKFIQGKAHRNNVKSTFRGGDKEIEQAYRILMSSDMTSDEVEEAIQNANQNIAVNTDKLKTVGNYAPLDIFNKEANWEAYKQLIPIGVGKKQQGPGEVAFAMLSRDVDEETKGDISIGGEIYELKLNGGRISDKAGPNPTKIKNIIAKYLGDSVMGYFESTQSLNTKEFVDKFVNKAKAEGIETDDMVREIYSEILDPEYAEKMVSAYQGDNVTFENVNKAFKEHSFDYYKSTKIGGGGEWNKLIGISTSDGGSVAVVETGKQFANTPMKNVNPRIVRTGSGTRENYIEFYPILG
jgi:hypothetical protein